MKGYGLLSKRRSVNPYKNIPKENSEVEIAENIVRRRYAFDTLWPLRVFGVDITFLRILGNKWAYLSAIKDFCTGEIVAHELSLNPNTVLQVVLCKWS
jgi:putative transposase